MADAKPIDAIGVISGLFTVAGYCALAMGGWHGAEALYAHATSLPANAVTELAAGAAGVATGWGIKTTVNAANGTAPAPAK